MQKIDGNYLTGLGVKVYEAIKLCQEVLNSNNEKEAENLVNELADVYSDYLPNIRYGFSNFTGEELNPISDLKKLMEKLELFLADHCKTPGQPASSGRGVNVQVTNQNNNRNTNQVSISIKQEFGLVRDEVQNCGYLHQEQIDEILGKIDEMEKIHGSAESKNKKWARLKDTVNWLTTKGVDIALKLWPLIFKIIDPDGTGQ